MKLNKILYLDDMRTPVDIGIAVVCNYDQFVQALKDEWDLISFDHDLSIDGGHYAQPEDFGKEIDYSKFTEKTGYDCAKWIVDNNYPLKFYAVHSFNPVGAANIRNLLRGSGVGEELQLKIPYRMKN